MDQVSNSLGPRSEGWRTLKFLIFPNKTYLAPFSKMDHDGGIDNYNQKLRFNVMVSIYIPPPKLPASRNSQCKLGKPSKGFGGHEGFPKKNPPISQADWCFA